MHLGVSVATVLRWETGVTSVTPPKLARVIEATNKPATYFVTNTEEAA